MFINENSIVINNVNMSKYLTRAKFGYYKTWSSDTGYNLANSFTGTFTGLFPKLVLTFKRLNQAEVQSLAPIFDSITQTVTYDDPVKGRYTMQTHTGDWEIEYIKMKKGQQFTVSFIANKPRS